VLNLKDLKSFIVYEFRGDRESGGFAGDMGCGGTSWRLEVTAPEWHEIATLSNITYVESISNSGNYFEGQRLGGSKVGSSDLSLAKGRAPGPSGKP